MAVPARRAGLLFCLAVLVFPLLFQGSRGLLEPDEGRYAEVAREMLASGDWLVPHLDGQPHFTKPPLTYWLTAVGLASLGRNTWGARIMLGLAWGATALLSGLIARRLWGAAAFRTGTVLLLLAFLPLAGGSILTTDMFLTLFETAAVLCFLEAWSGGPRHRLWAGGMGVGFGLCFLTKGPPGLLPLAAIAVFVAWRGRGWRGRIWSAWGLAAGLVIGLGWYVAVMVRTPGLGRYFFGDEVYARIFTSEHHRHNPWPLHLATLLVGSLPWCLALPPAAGGWRPTVARLVARARRPGDDRVRFLLLWLLLPLGVFLVSRSRLPLYLLPLSVPLSAIGAGLLHGGTGAPGVTPGRGFWRFAASWALVLLVLKGTAALGIPWRQDMRELARAVADLAPAGAKVIAIGDEPLHGLRFYRDGRLENWGDGPAVPPGQPPVGLANALRAQRSGAAADGVTRVFVAQPGARWIDGNFERAGLAPVASVRGRDLYVIEPPPASRP